MSGTHTFVIVGGGLAGAKAAEALRDQGFDGRIVLYAQESRLPYERPPLSKDFLVDKAQPGDFTVHDASWYRDHDIDLHLGAAVAEIDRRTRTVSLGDGERVSYHRLLLATGSRARHPRIPGGDATGVYSLRTLEDAEALKGVLTPGTSLAVVGGGWIGLEVAASARQRGVDVAVVEAADLPLRNALGPEVAKVFAALHRDHGVDLRVKTSVEAITTADGAASGLKLDDGSGVTADAVLVAVGAAANIELAERAGLTMASGGVAVDCALRTSDPDIFAVGDIAAADNPVFGARVRTEHWATALKQPAVAASGMVGKTAEYDEIPYFFTDQYDLGMEYVGHSPGYQRVLFRGDPDNGEFTSFWLDGDDRVLAGMNVNIWEGLDDIKAVIRARRPVDTDRLTDPSRPLAEVL